MTAAGRVPEARLPGWSDRQDEAANANADRAAGTTAAAPDLTAATLLAVLPPERRAAIWQQIEFSVDMYRNLAPIADPREATEALDALGVWPGGSTAYAMPLLRELLGETHAHIAGVVDAARGGCAEEADRG